MKEFQYTIKDEIGIHARPAGMLVQRAKQFSSKVMLECNGKKAEATKLMAIMSLGVKCGAPVKVTVEGADEEAAAADLELFFREHL